MGGIIIYMTLLVNWGQTMYEIPLPVSAIMDINQEVAELFHSGAGC